MHQSWVFLIAAIVLVVLCIAMYTTALQFPSGDKRRREFLIMGIVMAVTALILLLLSYYVSNYLCPGSPHVPVRCKSFPWEN